MVVLLLSAVAPETFPAKVQHRPGSLYIWWEAMQMVNGAIDGGVTDHQAQDRLISFCKASEVGIDRLYFLSVPSESDPGSLARFLAEAGQAGLHVYAVPRGRIQHRWIRPLQQEGGCDHRTVLAWVDQVIAFNDSNRQARFAGIQLDIEPHNARPVEGGRPLWRKNRQGLRNSRINRKIAGEYLELLDRIGERISASGSGLRLAVTLPPWLDRHDEKASYRLEYGGNEKVWIHHVMDRVDHVTLMNYVNGYSRKSRRRAWRAVAGEISYGRCDVLFQTARPTRSGPTRRSTVYFGGEKRYLYLKRLLERKYSGSRNYMGCGAHYYLYAYGSGRRGWPRHGDRAFRSPASSSGRR